MAMSMGLPDNPFPPSRTATVNAIERQTPFPFPVPSYHKVTIRHKKTECRNKFRTRSSQL